MKKSLYLISTAMLFAAAATPAWAQEDAQGETAQPASSDPEDEGLIVTAQRREQRLQDVPVAVSAFTANSLDERAVSDVAQLSNIAPNVTLDAGTPFSGSDAVLSAYIRGIGANDFAFNLDPGVGIYLDGVYLARTVGANQDLLDVERVEVLRGPAGHPVRPQHDRRRGQHRHPRRRATTSSSAATSPPAASTASRSAPRSTSRSASPSAPR